MPCDPPMRLPRRKMAKNMKKCYRAGVHTRNPFLNFLRKYRKEHCGLSITELAVEAAKVWNKMEKCDKMEFYVEALHARPYSRRDRSRSKNRSRSLSRAESSKRSRSNTRSRSRTRGRSRSRGVSRSRSGGRSRSLKR